MPKLRLAIKKEAALQFLSHLDFARAVRYIIVRSQLPVCYSEGFNPHMKINFASALGVGVSAAVEYMDMELSDEIPVQNVIDKMNENAPIGFCVLDAKYVPDKCPKLMALGNFAIYDLSGPVTKQVSDDDLSAMLAEFNDKDCVEYHKISPKNHHERIINVKKHVIDPITGAVRGDTLSLHVGILQTDEGAIKPSEVWAVLAEQFGFPIQSDMMLAHRTHIYHREKDELISLFDRTEF